MRYVYRKWGCGEPCGLTVLSVWWAHAVWSALSFCRALAARAILHGGDLLRIDESITVAVRPPHESLHSLRQFVADAYFAVAVFVVLHQIERAALLLASGTLLPVRLAFRVGLFGFRIGLEPALVIVLLRTTFLITGT